MIDQTNSLNLPRFRGGRLTRHDRRVLNATAEAKTAAWLATPEMVAHRETLLTQASAVAAFTTRPTRVLIRSRAAL
ncbi:hypothetical protein [Variovorax sp. YR566]|uniref:hypothetical protein n=1 Tax=Variovorax sp. YR566 TaxID=3450237 RepID=UPI003F8023C2